MSTPGTAAATAARLANQMKVCVACEDMKSVIHFAQAPTGGRVIHVCNDCVAVARGAAERRRRRAR